jgi:hypothetical protein
MTFKLKLNPDNTVSVFGLKQKHTGTVLHPSLSNYILTKHPQLADSKIVSLNHSDLRSTMLEWLES